APKLSLSPGERVGVRANNKLTFPFRGSTQNIIDHMAVNIGETETAALVQVSQALVVNAKLMEDRGLKVMHVDRAGGEHRLVRVQRLAIGIGDVVTVIVGPAVSHARLDATAGEPDRE